jgi:hypothetical protein
MRAAALGGVAARAHRQIHGAAAPSFAAGAAAMARVLAFSAYLYSFQ